MPSRLHHLPLALVWSLPALAGCPAPQPADPSTDGATIGTTAASIDATTAVDPATSTTTSPTTGDPVDPDSDPNAFFAPARQGDAAYVVRISPATGVVEPFGPALPEPADDIAWDLVRATADRKRVAVLAYLAADTPVLTMFVGDGAGWEMVAKFNKFGLGGHELAPDASLLWFDEVAKVGDVPSFQATVIDLSGEPVFTGEALGAAERLAPRAFGPDGAWFIFHDPKRGAVLRTRTGDESTLPVTAALLGFPTSVILATANGLQWHDLQGQPLTVPGFDGATNSASPFGYQVASGTLARLLDRKVQVLQQVPAATPAFGVADHVDNAFALARPGDGADHAVLGLDGGVIAQFVPLPSPTFTDPDLPGIESFTFLAASCLACPSRVVALGAANQVLVDGFVSDEDMSVQLWRLAVDGTALEQSVIVPWQYYDKHPREFHFSADGQYLTWIEDQTVKRLATETAKVEIFDAFVILDDYQP